MWLTKLANINVLYAKAGKPVAKLSSYKEKLKPRKSGLWKGKVWVSPDFDEEDEEINKLFYQKEGLAFSSNSFA